MSRLDGKVAIITSADVVPFLQRCLRRGQKLHSSEATEPLP